MSDERLLIVNADDFGLSPSVNRGIIQSHEQGIVTSASLMVRGPAAGEAADYARANPQLGVGLHVEIEEWEFHDGQWRRRYSIVPADDADAIAAELDRQLGLFRDLLGRDPTHIDSHQHVHQRQPARGVFIDLARRLDLPLRGCDPRVRYRGDFYGQSAEGFPCHDCITPAALLQTATSLTPGVTELGCHPGYAESLDTVYREERALEVATLCDAQVRRGLANLKIRLVSFASVVKQ